MRVGCGSVLDGWGEREQGQNRADLVETRRSEAETSASSAALFSLRRKTSYSITCTSHGNSQVSSSYIPISF